MKWTSRILAIALLFLVLPVCAEETISQEASVEINSVWNLSSTLTISPSSSVKVQTITFYIDIYNTGSRNLTNVSAYLEITDPLNNTPESIYLDNVGSNYTVLPGETLRITHTWGNNDCPGGCTVGAYITNVTVHADSVTDQNLTGNFTVSNPPSPPPPSGPSGGSASPGGAMAPPLVESCVPDIGVTPFSIGLRERAPAKGLEVVTVRNLGNCDDTISLVLARNLRGTVTLSQAGLFLPKGGSGDFSVEISESRPGIYKGTIEIWSGDILLKTIQVELFVLSNLESLVDIDVDIPAEFLEVQIVKGVQGKITIANLGASESEDVEVTMTVMKLGGSPLRSVTEKFSVRDYVVLTRNMPVPDEPGEYVLNVAIAYGDKTARSSRFFKVVESPVITADIFSQAVDPNNLIKALMMVISVLLLFGIPVGGAILTIKYMTNKGNRKVASQNAEILEAAKQSLEAKAEKSRKKKAARQERRGSSTTRTGKTLISFWKGKEV